MWDDVLGRSPEELAVLVGIVVICMIVGRIVAIPASFAVRRGLVRAGKTRNWHQFHTRWIARLGMVLGLIVGLETVGIATAPLIAASLSLAW